MSKKHRALSLVGGVLLAGTTVLAGSATAGAAPANAAPGEVVDEMLVFDSTALAPDQCIRRTGNNSWGQGVITACARRNGNSSYDSWVKDKKADGHCVRWRVVYNNRVTKYTAWACPKGDTTRDIKNRLGRFGSVKAFLQRVKV
ncbi:hypothetical protein GCM10012275_44380 [Longimycelium tulufanense]|uniref:Uncharacterized protein n=1 Tax=Longimycelium tulufanense TaxID=907463 RepID=A0A8J3FY58_9PSEU|nr:hypothetical protein [Longimycelium tulufanense]GGM69095.1 hypothetical protein GCM10012275_44380 [Longimycelium tulufanense]